MKKVIVTGGLGFIGSNLIYELVAQGHEVISIDDYSSGLKENELDGVKYVNLDINLIGQLDESFDICFHLAAKSRVQPSFNDPTADTEIISVTPNCLRASIFALKLILDGFMKCPLPCLGKK